MPAHQHIALVSTISGEHAHLQVGDKTLCGEQPMFPLRNSKKASCSWCLRMIGKISQMV